MAKFFVVILVAFSVIFFWNCDSECKRTIIEDIMQKR